MPRGLLRPQVKLPGSPPFALPEALLQRAVASADPGLAADALQMACFQQKANVLPCAPADCYARALWISSPAFFVVLQHLPV